MSLKKLFLALAAVFALTSTVQAAFRINEKKSGTFGVFELVDCGAVGARPKLLKADQGPVLYCVAAKPLIEKSHLKSAEAMTNDLGRPYLSLDLTREGGRIMAAASKRLLDERETRGNPARFAFVINGRLFAVPTLRNAIKDHFVIEGGFTQRELESIAKSLMKAKIDAHPTSEDTRDSSQ